MVKGNNLLQVCLAFTTLWWGVSCSRDSGDKPIVATAENSPYFSLQHYFQEEIDRLQRADPSVQKTVSKNGDTEHLQTHIANWQNELALFIESDINKPAWKSSYQVDSSATMLRYMSTDPKLRTTEITIERTDGGSIKHIVVSNRVNNVLYQTEEQLDYYPDSLYRIARQQRVRFIGDSDYVVIGEIN